MKYQEKIDMMSKYLQHGPPYKYKEVDHVYSYWRRMLRSIDSLS